MTEPTTTSAGAGPAAIAAQPMTPGRLHDLIDEATQDMTTDELRAVLDFAASVRAGRQQKKVA